MRVRPGVLLTFAIWLFVNQLIKDDFPTLDLPRNATLGFRKICEREDLTFGQLMMVYQHHERLDGGGYPVGVSGDEIHDWARLCTVVDVFEALTSNRSYRAKMTASDSFAIMDRSSGTAFDRSVYECWKATMQKR